MNDNDTGMLFDLRDRASLDLFAKTCAALQCHQVEFTVTQDGRWVIIHVGGAR